MTHEHKPGIRSASTPQVSVVVPVYNSEECVEALVAQTSAALVEAGRTFELLLVNDASRDGTWARIRTLAGQYPCLRAVCLRRNFGQDNAIMAGLTCVHGTVIVIMDDDLQHDPRDMEQLIRKVEAGADVCYANFAHKRQAWWKNLGSRFNGFMARLVLQKPREIYLSPYKAVSAAVVREIIKYAGPFPYVDGLIFRVTDNITQVPVTHRERFAGKSNYGPLRSVAVWLRLATGFSVVPLRLATYLGFVYAAFGLSLALFFAIARMLRPETPMGWASTIVAVLVMAGVQLVCLGLVGEYLGRVFIHLNRRPQFVVKEVIETTPDA